ncbi:MAG: 1-acyl-sn-glycerol-3-phosphate acyltransferase [Deltaproteobacteria bacterium]|nr:1-acyl-sn-glycerol-3-phosphate acyltransferase [Deltaproteobacteria bacterium]MBW2081943.1 1-acyl-sn-glycerol-3-phosphate acyltransferase [Deltaproteobacteria bacterium]HDM10665.1 1-acyl-sn-glycerol-3-phosphate acyltransferase [Desulfobacteraceae bacterium]
MVGRLEREIMRDLGAMIRTFFVNTIIIIHSIFMCLWGLVLVPFDRNGRLIHFYAAVPWAKAILWYCGVKVITKGLGNVDRTVPRIYMTNHQSYLDVFGLLSVLPVDFKFLMKQELMKIPLLGFAMKRAGYIGIERGDPRMAVESMKAAAERIQEGASVLIFPEGTRSEDGTLQTFKRGGFNLALRAGCEIMPIGIGGSGRLLPKGSFRVKRGTFAISVGRPIVTCKYRKKTIDLLMEEVRGAIEGLKAESEELLKSDG